MTNLELALLALAKRHRSLFQRIADAYRGGIPVDERTGYAFLRLPEITLLILRYSTDEVMVALETVCKAMIESEERA